MIILLWFPILHIKSLKAPPPPCELKLEVLSIMKLLNNFKITKINRHANVVAHEIAKSKLDGVLPSSVPHYKAYVVRNDCMNILID